MKQRIRNYILEWTELFQRKNGMFHQTFRAILCLLLIVMLIFQLVLYMFMYSSMKRSIRDSNQENLHSIVALAEMKFSVLEDAAEKLAEGEAVLNAVLLPQKQDRNRNFDLMSRLSSFKKNNAYVEELYLISRFDGRVYSTESGMVSLSDGADEGEEVCGKVGGDFSLVRTEGGTLYLSYPFLDGWQGNLGTLLIQLDGDRLFGDICNENKEILLLTKDNGLLFSAGNFMEKDLKEGLDEAKEQYVIRDSQMLDIRFACRYQPVVLSLGSFLIDGNVLVLLMAIIPLILIAALLIARQFYKPMKEVMETVGPAFSSESDEENEWKLLRTAIYDLNDRNRQFGNMVHKVSPYLFQNLMTDLLEGREIEEGYMMQLLTSIQCPFTIEGDFVLFVTVNRVTGLFDEVAAEEVVENMEKIRYKDCCKYTGWFKGAIITLVQMGTQASVSAEKSCEELKRIVQVYTDELDDRVVLGGEMFHGITEMNRVYCGIMDRGLDLVQTQMDEKELEKHIEKAMEIAAEMPEEKQVVAVTNLMEYIGEAAGEDRGPALKTLTDVVRRLGEQYHVKLSSQWDEGCGMEDAKAYTQEVLREIYSIKNKKQYKYFLIAQRYMEENYMNTELSLNMVAAELGISATYLSRIFTSVHNTRFTQMLNEIRIDKAKVLLEDSDRLIRDISEAVGFLTIQNFMRVFKQQTGLTPSGYRATLKSG